jgi:hypothetical protein
MQARNGKEVMGVMDRYFVRRKLRAVARYERCEISAFWATRGQPKHEATHGAGTNRSYRIPDCREGVETGLLKGSVIPRGFAGP